MSNKDFETLNPKNISADPQPDRVDSVGQATTEATVRPATDDLIASQKTLKTSAFTLGTVIWLVVAAVFYAYSVWAAIAFTGTKDFGWITVSMITPQVKPIIVSVGVATPIIMLMAACWLTLRKPWWTKLLVYLTGWAIVPCVVTTVQYIMWTSPVR